MRKALRLALIVAVVAGFSLPLTVLAQNQLATASVAGRSVDVAGRGLSGERVELLVDTTVVSTTKTNGLGEWSFDGIAPGVYTVRMNVRGRIAGVRVTVAAGQVISGTMVVVPAATASLQLGSLANLLTLVPAASTATVSATAATVQNVETTELNPDLLVAVLNAMDSNDREAFANAVVAAVTQTNQGAAAPFTQYVEQFQAIAANPAAPVVANTFPAPKPNVS